MWQLCFLKYLLLGNMAFSVYWFIILSGSVTFSICWCIYWQGVWHFQYVDVFTVKKYDIFSLLMYFLSGSVTFSLCWCIYCQEVWHFQYIDVLRKVYIKLYVSVLQFTFIVRKQDIWFCGWCIVLLENVTFVFWG